MLSEAKSIMKKLNDYPDAKHILVSGDIHGDFRGLVYKLCVQYGLKDTLLVVAGDCGFGFEKPGYYDTVYSQVAGRLRKANNWVVFVRGNHDDPSYFTEEKICYERWRCVPDYSVIQACGHHILCVGGAVSVDRYVRKQENARMRERGHMQTAVWWPDEAPVFSLDEIDSIPDDIRIDTVVTHTAPSFCELQNKQGLKSWAVMDPALVWETGKERGTIDSLFRYLLEKGHPLSRWYYGHFHQSWRGEREGVTFHMLDIEEIHELTTSDSRDLPANPERHISIYGRNGNFVTLQWISGDTYLLCGDLDYMSVVCGDVPGTILAVDPSGGPYIGVGEKVGDKTITEIHEKDGEYYFTLV